MTFEDLDLNKKYTYSDYLKWQFDEMVELIRGKIYKKPPAPSLYHQRVSSQLHRIISNYLNNKKCDIFHAPFDVRLPLPPKHQKAGKIDTVVQPDLSIICDRKKLDARGCEGAPDWIIEILSPGSSSKDLNEKFDVYEHAGVREYWIVHPHEFTVLVYRLNEEGKYEGDLKPYTKIDTVAANIFSDFQINLGKVFPDENYPN